MGISLVGVNSSLLAAERVSQSQSSSGAKQAGQLSAEEQSEVEKLKARDREVRAHEQAHIAAGGGLVRGGASYELKRGPDGRMYAIGGEVQIDASPVDGDPQATIQKAQRIKAAAMAPASPSGQDLAVASAATQMAAQARMEMAREKYQAGQGAQTGGKVDYFA